jgi:thiopurine S-methyltransferase
MQESYVAHMLRLLDGKARILLVTIELEQTEVKGPPFSVSHADVERLYGDAAEIRLLSRRTTEESAARVFRNAVYLITQVSPGSVR